ncbi:MAG: hypothetical protein H5T97_09575, partial [Firmicutes bacterium]|nr:hypothetical protein [Bacillota bacterium]
ETERIVTEIERDVPALVEVLTAYAMIDLPDRTREFIRAWNRGPKALEELLVTEVGRSMLAGMVIEHARQERNRDDAA